MGYIEETGAAQFMRDARIAANLRRRQRHPGDRPRPAQDRARGRRDGEARDRRHPRDRGRRRRARIEAFGATARRLGEAANALDTSTKYLLEALARDPADAWRRNAVSTPFRPRARRRLLAKAGLGRTGAGQRRRAARRVALARFFAEKLATAAPGLAETVLSGDAAAQILRIRASEFA